MENPGLLNDVDDKLIIHRVDLLVALQAIWGENILRCRNQLYKLVSGSCTDIELRQYLKFFYLRSPAFSNFVTKEYYFGNQSKPLVRRIVEPARERIDTYYQQLVRMGLNIIGQDEDYLYFSTETGEPPELKGVTRVC